MKYKKINLKYLWMLLLLLILITVSAILKSSIQVSAIAWVIIIVFGLIYSTLFSILIKSPLYISKYEFTVPKDYKDPLRISCSALVRIYVHGKYFLVNKKTKTLKYQPVGGAYHFLTPTFTNFDFIKDITGEANDLKIEGSIKKLEDFIAWFDQKNPFEREINPHREIKEKLFNSGILNENDFGEIRPKFIKRVYKNNSISYSIHYKKFELIIFEIFNLDLSEKQVELFKRLMISPSDEYIFVTEDDVKCDEQERYLFADNVKYIYNEDEQ